MIIFLAFTKELGSSSSELHQHQIPTMESLRRLISNRDIAILAFIRTLYSTSNNTFNTLFSLYAVNQLGFNAGQVSALFSAMGLANTSIKIPVGSLSDKFGRKRMLFATFTSIIIIYVALATFTVYTALAVTIMVFGAAWGSRATVEWAALTSRVEPDVKTLAVGFMENFWDIGAATGSFLAGLLSGFLPVPTIMMLMVGLNAPSLPAIMRLKEEKD